MMIRKQIQRLLEIYHNAKLLQIQKTNVSFHTGQNIFNTKK